MAAMKCYRISLAIVGGIALLAGVAHFAWYGFMRGYPELAALGEAQWRWLALLNQSVGLLLVFLGVTTLAVATSRSAGLGLLRTLAAVLFATWCVRFAFELVWPVPIPFFVISAPSGFFEALVGALLAILAAPELLLITGVARR
jgi:hypothetical protein